MPSESASYFSRLRQRLQGRKPELAAEALYRAIVAQARLKAFYNRLGVPDTLEGRYAVLGLHMFAILYRLKVEGPEGAPLAQALIDRFTADMDTVMREIGVSDLRVPKKVRTLAAAFQAALHRYDAALAAGESDLAAAIAHHLPEGAEAAAAPLVPYLISLIETLRRQPLPGLVQGMVHFPQVIEPRHA